MRGCLKRQPFFVAKKPVSMTLGLGNLITTKKE